jgi:SPX domain protein involved in polyphosphate accumulation
MNIPAFNDRIEKKFQVGIQQREVGAFWQDLSSFLPGYGLQPVQEITAVSSVYFDNKDCDLLRYCLFGHLMLFRTRVHELYGHIPVPIDQYWVEVKTAAGSRRQKRRFPITKHALLSFLDGGRWADVSGARARQPEAIEYAELYRQSQETFLTMGLQPLLLVTYKRVAFQGETSRLSIDWDVEYHHVTNSIFDLPSWKYLTMPPVGKADKVILELKCITDESASKWFAELRDRYPIRDREYLKPVEGMGFLFAGPLQGHKEAHFFKPLIDSYMKNSLLG